MIAETLSASGVREAQSLIERSGLRFDTGFDEMLGLYDEAGQLVAVGARAGNILKMLAVDADHQGGAVLGELVTALVNHALAAGHASLFVYTKPEYATSFQALNFELLASQDKVVLLEYGHGLTRWLEAQRGTIRSGSKGAVVMNCNPFTLGHRYLIENAASQVDQLFLFVVREDRSAFPFEVRLALVKAGVRDLANVTVLDSSHYLVSAATFPTYFLKQDDPVARIQMELDASLFAGRIAPFFGICRRFVGTEPSCPLTRSYNETMKRILPFFDLELVEIERKQCAATAISASRVRELIGRNELSGLAELVPETTLAYLLSADAAPIRNELQMMKE